MKTEKNRTRSVEEKYVRANRVRSMFLTCTIVLLVMPVVGYVVDKLVSERLVFPTREEWRYFPINFGTYGLMGFIGVGLIILIIATIVVLIKMMQTNGFSLFGVLFSIGGTILFYGLIVSAFVGVVSWISNVIRTDFVFSFLGAYIDGSKTIPGISDTLGVAVLNTSLYCFILALCIIGTMMSWRRCQRLKIPALEERRIRETKEQRADEERIRQKRLLKERKEQKIKTSGEYEKSQAENNSLGLGEYSFFEGCTTVEQLDSRFEKMLQIYEASDGSGDLALASVIRKQHKLLKEHLQSQDVI